MSTNRRCMTIAVMAFDENHSLGKLLGSWRMWCYRATLYHIFYDMRNLGGGQLVAVEPRYKFY